MFKFLKVFALSAAMLLASLQFTQAQCIGDSVTFVVDSAPQGCWGLSVSITECGQTCSASIGGCDWGDVSVGWITEFLCN